MTPYLVMVGVVGGLARTGTWVDERVAPTASGTQVPPSRRPWNFFEMLVALLLVAFSAARLEVGTDYELYVRLYERVGQERGIGQAIASSPQDVGFTTVSYLLTLATDSPRPLLVLSAALSVLPVLAVIRARSSDPVLALLMWVLLAYYVSSFNTVRQGIAVGLSVWAFHTLSRSWRGFVFLSVVAATFHISSLLAAAAVLATCHLRLSRSSTTVLLVVTSVVGVAVMNSSALVSAVALASPRYATYLLSAEPAGIGTYLVILAKTLLLGVCLFLQRGREEQWANHLLVAGVVFLVLGTQVVPVARMEQYFGIYVVLLLPDLLAARLGDRPAAHLLARAGVIAACGVFFVVYLVHFGGLLPYRTFY